MYHKLINPKSIRIKSFLLGALSIVYRRHILIFKNKKYINKVNTISSLNTVMAGLWSTHAVEINYSSTKILKYLFLYYTYALSYILNYFL